MATKDQHTRLVEQPINRFASDQLDLLRAIQATGSITGAAKLVGISYKTAWDRLDRLNNLSRSPLVDRVAGGSNGGGTRLTGYGESLVQSLALLQEQQQTVLQELEHAGKSDDLSGFVKHAKVLSSARNQLRGTVTVLTPGAVNTEVIIEIADALPLVAVISERSRDDMDLAVGDEVLALIKASSVTLATGAVLQVSARNCFSGEIVRLDKGSVNTDVTIEIGENKTLSAMITNTSSQMLGLKTGQVVSAFFKASSVILMRS